MDGVGLIQAERERQKNVEGWTPEHDDEHIMGEMIGASVTYAAHALEIVSDGEVPGADNEGWWPWDEQHWKPSPDPIRNLVKAGALIAAEIDRLQRLAAKSVTSPRSAASRNRIEWTMTYVYVCNAMGCEDLQNKFCGYGYACPFCGEGRMVLDEERTEESNEDE